MEDGSEHESQTMGALPLINHYLDRVGLPALLSHVNHAVPGAGPSPSQCLGVLVRNIILERGPVYGLSDWGAPAPATLLGADAVRVRDDRVGRALDRLFDADRASLQTRLVVRVVREFAIDLSQVHNDSTTIPLQGAYADADGGFQRGRKTLRAARGHSKDHRPDLKQLLWTLTVTRDGTVPVHYKAYDGNTNDSPTHWETWEAVRALAGRADFLYVTDSKGSGSDFLQHVHAQGGRFVAVLPRTRSEDAAFRDWVQTHEAGWQTVAAQEGVVTWRAVEAPVPSAEGFRIVWVQSPQNAERDRRVRHARVQRVVAALADLDRRLGSPRTRIKTRPGVIEAADALVGDAARWVAYEVREESADSFKQERRGRPGPSTKYVRVSKPRFRVHSRVDDGALGYDAKTDGAFPLITNTKAQVLDLAGVFAAYKYQPYLEKRHEQLKTVYSAAPVFLHNITRVEALLFLYFAAMIVQALIERDVRQAMVRRHVESLPLYPEGRACMAPTADRVLAVFEHVQVHHVRQGGQRVRTYWPRLSPLQKQLLDLLRIPEAVYGPQPV